MLLLLSTICSCSSASIKNDLLGSWMSCTEDGETSAVLELRFDGNTVSQYMFNSFIRSGTYVISGNNITCNFDGNENYDEHQLILEYSFDGNLKLKTQDSDWWNLKKTY